MNWSIKKIEKKVIDNFSKNLNLDEYRSLMLYARGIRSIPEAAHYLYPRYSALSSPFLLKGMSEAVSRIRVAVDNGETIGIFSDSDLDGLTSLSVLMHLFERFNITPQVRYPVGDESYGLSNLVIDEMKEKDVTLLITLDSGIRDIPEIKHARDCGIDVIVCDHHTPGEELPDSIVVNPKQLGCPYPYKHMAGVGVTFKLCLGYLMSYLHSFNQQFLIVMAGKSDIWASIIKNSIVEEVIQCTDLEDLEAFASKKDDNLNIVLAGENRILEPVTQRFRGKKIFQLNELASSALGKPNNSTLMDLNSLCKQFSLQRAGFTREIDIINVLFAEVECLLSKKIKEFIDATIGLVAVGTIADIMPVTGENRTIVHYGIRSLKKTLHPGMSKLLAEIRIINSKSISWNIIPLLNSPGRFGKTELAAQFFLGSNNKNIEEILDELFRINNDRKEIVADTYSSIVADLDAGKINIGGNLLFLEIADIPEGITGLLANRVAEYLNKPVIIVSVNGNNNYAKGSGRAVCETFDFFSYVEPFAHLFERVGGHPQAFGFTTSISNMSRIREQIESSIGNNYGCQREIAIDVELPIEKINIDFVESLAIFEPYGYHNEEPVFLSRNVELQDFRVIGKDGIHGKFIINNGHGLEAVGWKKAQWMEEIFPKKNIDIVYNLEKNEYNGHITPQIVIIDMK